MKVELYEMEYSVSPGGKNCWEATVYTGLGHSTNYSEYKSAGDALDHLLSVYPAVNLEVDVMSLEAYNDMLERENV
jgi:hypothetical protein